MAAAALLSERDMESHIRLLRLNVHRPQKDSLRIDGKHPSPE